MRVNSSLVQGSTDPHGQSSTMREGEGVVTPEQGTAPRTFGSKCTRQYIVRC